MKDKIISYQYLLYLFFILSYIFSSGFYTLAGASMLLILLGIFVMFVFSDKKIFNLNNLPSSPTTVKLIFILSLFFSLLLYGGFYQNQESFFVASQILLIICLCLTLFPSNFLKYWRIYFLIYSILGILMIISSPSPQIDVFFMLREGALGLLKGLNPYNLDYTAVYGSPFHFFSYLPGMILLTMPGSIIFNDPRFAILAAVMATAWLIAKKLKDPESSLLFLYNPISLFVLEQSWTDSLIFFLMILFVYLALKKKFFISALIFGIMLASKQYCIFFLALALSFYHKNIKFLFLSIIVATGIILPFVIWNPEMFWYGVIITPSSGVGFRKDGLTLISLIYNYFSAIPSFFLLLPVWVISFILIFLSWKKLSWGTLILRIFLFTFIFFYINLYAFANYYYFLSSLLLASIALSRANKQDFS